MTVRDKDPQRNGHTTPAGMSVLDDLNLDPEFVADAKRRIAEMVAAQREAELVAPKAPKDAA